MAGFAINLKRLLRYPQAKFDSIPGLQESRFLQMIETKMSLLEPKAENCSKVFELVFFNDREFSQFFPQHKGLGLAHKNVIIASNSNRRKPQA